MKNIVSVLPAAMLSCLLSASPSAAQTNANTQGSEEARKLNAQAVALHKTLEQCACALRQNKKPLDASKMQQRAALIERKANPNITPVEGGVLRGYAVHKEQPSYPPAAKAARVSGSVFIKVVVDEAGEVIDAKILCGADLLAVAAREAAYRWRFNPSVIDGRPVKVQGVLTFNFTLR